MTFGNTTDGRIAGHLANHFEAKSHERSLTTHARACGRSLAACVSGPDNNHVEIFVEAFLHFPMQKEEKISDRTSSGVVSPVISPKKRKASYRFARIISSLTASENRLSVERRESLVRLKRS